MTKHLFLILSLICIFATCYQEDQNIISSTIPTGSIEGSNYMLLPSLTEKKDTVIEFSSNTVNWRLEIAIPNAEKSLTEANWIECDYAKVATTSTKGAFSAKWAIHLILDPSVSDNLQMAILKIRNTKEPYNVLDSLIVSVLPNEY